MDASIDRDFLVQLTRDLIRFRSVNPPGNERPIAEFLGNTMREIGLTVDLQHLEPDRSNVIGRMAGPSPGALVFTGHLDVVPPGGQPWVHDPFGAELIDGTIYGRGSVDMKGGVAAIVAALEALRRAGFEPRAEVVLAATAGEEAGLLGAQAMVERRSLEGARFLVVAEPTGLDVFVAEKGVLWVEIRALGRTAHGAMPALGVNAVSYLARLIPQLESYPFNYTESGLLGRPTLSVNIIEGGNKTNVVPDVCRIVVDMRTVPGQDHGAMLGQIEEMARTLAGQHAPEIGIEIAIENDVGPLETPRSEALVEAIVTSVARVRGTAPAVGGVPYATDAAYLAPGFDVPMVICGPGGTDMLHQPDEHVAVEQLVQAAEIYADLAQRLVG